MLGAAVRARRRLVPLVAMAICLGILFPHAETTAAEKAPSQWESAIKAFEKKDEESPPAEGGVLFLGSSSIRMWDVEKYFPRLSALNRGFGGSQIADSIQFAPRIVFPYKPQAIVFYAGDNDIARGKTPETVAADFRTFVGVVHTALPETRIIFISIKPSLARWDMVGAMREANGLIEKFVGTDEGLSYVDLDGPMLDQDAKPREELFMKDGLHLTSKGYALWTERLGPVLSRALDAGKGKVASP